MTSRLLVAALALAIATGPSLAVDAAGLPDGVDPATGFRMDRYKAPVPHLLPGGTIVDAAGVKAAASDGATVLVDVYPARGGGPREDGTWRLAEPRDTIPGAVWIANAGFGSLDGPTEAYVRRSLAAATQGDPARPLLFFCAADCWHSWNAARRAILWGYTDVRWYPDGTEGWADAGGALVAAEPVNFLAPDI